MTDLSGSWGWTWEERQNNGVYWSPCLSDSSCAVPVIQISLSIFPYFDILFHDLTGIIFWGGLRSKDRLSWWLAGDRKRIVKRISTVNQANIDLKKNVNHILETESMAHTHNWDPIAWLGGFHSTI